MHIRAYFLLVNYPYTIYRVTELLRNMLQNYDLAKATGLRGALAPVARQRHNFHNRIECQFIEA